LQPRLVHLLVRDPDAADVPGFPALLPRLGFWPTLAACVLITLVCFGLFALLLRRFGINLL
jgi:hypothetical protein